jgi:hypothetical protein
MHKLESLLVSLILAALCCKGLSSHLVQLKERRKQGVAALASPHPVPRSSLYYQLVQEALHELQLNVFYQSSSVVYASQLRDYIVKGFLTHGYNKADALVSSHRFTWLK